MLSLINRSEFTHNRAAYAREDVEDSKRGRPDIDLRSLAAHRGMRFRGPIRMGAFMSASPIWPDYVFNAMDGALPSGRYGLIQHELDQQAIDQDDFDQGGTYYSVRTMWRNPDDWKAFLTYGLIGGQKKVPNEPFAGNYAWLPASSVSVRVPETNVLGPIDIRRSSNFPRWGVKDLGDLGVGGFRAAGLDGIGADIDVVAVALSGQAGEALRGCSYDYVRVEVGYGLVTLRRNGFASEEEIAELTDRAERIAAGLAEACSRVAAPQPFEQAVPPAAPAPQLTRKQQAFAELADSGVTDAGARIAAELGLEVEDPRSFSRAFPTVPVPGTARIVSRGPIPGTSSIGRVLFTKQGRRAGSTLRGAVLLPASSRAPQLPLGGESVEETNMYGEVADGIAAVWDRGRVTGRLDARDLIERAVRTARTLGIADV